MIEKLVTNNIEVVGVELGSELSNRSYFTKGYTIEDYILSAKSCSKKIKDKYPNLKTAVVTAPLGKRKGHRHNVWNEKLSKLDFYDDIIIHSYAKVVKGKKEFGQMLTIEPEGENQIEAFDIYKKRALKFLNTDFPDEIKRYNTIFNKPIWITEWNANPKRSPDTQRKFMELALKWMDTCHFIERYSWFQPFPVISKEMFSAEGMANTAKKMKDLRKTIPVTTSLSNDFGLLSSKICSGRFEKYQEHTFRNSRREKMCCVWFY